MHNFFTSFRRFLAIILYPEVLEIEHQNKVSMDFVINLSREWKNDVKAKERGISKLNKKIKYLNNQLDQKNNERPAD